MNTRSATSLAENADAQASPVEYVASGQSELLKIDRAVGFHGGCIVVGWSSDPSLALSLSDAKGRIDATVDRAARPDVADSLLKAGAPELGFVIVSRRGVEGPLKIHCGDHDRPFELPVRLGNTLEEDVRAFVAAEVLKHLSEAPVGSDRWLGLRQWLPERSPIQPIISGAIDELWSGLDASGGFVSGWVTQRENALVWLEDDQGGAHSINSSFRYVRDDVRRADPDVPIATHEVGFFSRIFLPRGAQAVRLCGATNQGVHRTEFSPARVLPWHTASVVRALVRVITPSHRLLERLRAIDLPMLSDVRTAEYRRWSESTVRSHSVGPQLERPEITVVVPLFGRFDLVENQLLELDRDPDFRSRVEVLYVLDDPDLEEGFARFAPRVQSLFGIGFKWITAGDNRGYSGANNLGASAARGETLIFANSDVFPRHPGWASSLAERLSADHTLGLVAPRLLFGDGTIQHVGMEPRWRADLGIYTNHHPLMGLEPDRDRTKDLSRVSLVTGACLAIRRSVFEDVGGWNDQYIAGDFEDSDLCFRIESAGYWVGYDPKVQLTHLERQSFDHTSDLSDVRARITILNACRFNTIWQDKLAEFAR